VALANCKEDPTGSCPLPIFTHMSLISLQVFAQPGVVERFAASPADALVIRSVFTGLWAGTDPEAVRRMTADPSHYVLKPQREGGGGNNFYGADAVAAYGRMNEHERAQHIIMQLVEPPSVKGCLVRKGERFNGASLSALLWWLMCVMSGNLVAELGVYGTLLCVGGVVEHNVACGHLIRSKFADTLDGGVAAGIAILDSPLLVDDVEH